MLLSMSVGVLGRAWVAALSQVVLSLAVAGACGGTAVVDGERPLDDDGTTTGDGGGRPRL